MKVCFPVVEVNGIASEVYGHFGSAPAFIIVETQNNNVTVINNKDQQHAHLELRGPEEGKARDPLGPAQEVGVEVAQQVLRAEDAVGEHVRRGDGHDHALVAGIQGVSHPRPVVGERKHDAEAEAQREAPEARPRQAADDRHEARHSPHVTPVLLFVTPAKAGVQWIPAFAGMTTSGSLLPKRLHLRVRHAPTGVPP